MLHPEIGLKKFYRSIYVSGEIRKRQKGKLANFYCLRWLISTCKDEESKV